jgi:FkbM family methyltransferase
MTRATDRVLWTVIRAAGQLRKQVRRYTGLQMKGVGFLLRRLRTDHEFEACGYRWYLDHRIAGPYANLLGDEFKEPETIALLKHIADHADFPFTFADVGANVGEMIIPMAMHARPARVIAFEPHPVCAQVIRANLQLNRAAKGEVRELLIGDGSMQPYVMDEFASPLSGIRPGAANATPTRTVRLDDQLSDGELVLLIDVEGAELEVLRSGRQLIARSRPLIVFEYHAETAKRFSLDEVRAVLGEGYQLLRLRGDGQVDDELRDMWNCVAVHRASRFRPLIELLRN